MPAESQDVKVLTVYVCPGCDLREAYGPAPCRNDAAHPRLARPTTVALEVVPRQEAEVLAEGIASALTSLGTGPGKDGYAYAVLEEALAKFRESTREDPDDKP